MGTLLTSEILSFIIISFGILVRLVQYLSNRSLWADEAVLALNIVNRSYSELLQPLDYDQGAPIGFLLIEKLAIQLLGNNEYALRLFPFLSSILALFLFYELAKKCIPKAAIPIGLTLFASLPFLIDYSSEVKQYSSDVAITLLLYLILMPLISRRLSQKEVIKFSVVGAIAIWFSHTSIFILAGIGCSYLLIAVLNKKSVAIKNILVIFLSWIISFVIFYWISLRNLSSNEDLMTSWKDAFPSSPFDIIWLLDAFGKFFYKPLGFTKWLDGLAILLFIIGCCICWIRKKEILLFLLSPLIVTFFAAYLHQYPFRSRLVLFLTPPIILLIAEGVNYIIQRTRFKQTKILSILIIVLLLFPPVLRASNLLINPESKEEIKPVISYIKTHRQPEDVLYIYQRGIYQFKYYAEKYGFQESDYILGVDDLDKYDGKGVSDEEKKRYQNDLEKLRGNKRVWLLFSHASVSEENELFNLYLNQIGTKIDTYETQGAFVYLYDLS